MAPRHKDEDLEIFSDLNGDPDKVVAADALLLSDESLAAAAAKEGDEDDEDLQIVDADADADGDEDGDGDADADGEDGESDDEVVDAVEAADPEILFNPSDVQVIIAESKELESREATVTADRDRAKSDAESAKIAMAKAMEDGDTKAHVEAAEKFADAKGAFQTATAKLENLASEKNGLKARANAVIAKAPKNDKGEAILDKVVFKKGAAAATPAAAKEKGSKLLPKFLEANKWFNDPKRSADRDVLIALDRALNKEGKLDKNDPKYFEELGRRFNKVKPGLFKTLDGKLIATGQRQRGAGTPIPGAGGGSGGGQPQQQGGKIRLTSEDVAQMRVFGLDPDDMKARRSWLNEKIAGVKADQRRGKVAA